jgi:hypothetical protein
MRFVVLKVMIHISHQIWSEFNFTTLSNIITTVQSYWIRRAGHSSLIDKNAYSILIWTTDNKETASEI